MGRAPTVRDCTAYGAVDIAGVSQPLVSCSSGPPSSSSPIVLTSSSVTLSSWRSWSTSEMYFPTSISWPEVIRANSNVASAAVGASFTDSISKVIWPYSGLIRKRSPAQSVAPYL